MKSISEEQEGQTKKNNYMSGEDKALAAVFITLILTIGGCGMFNTYQSESTARKKEKTKQMIIEWRKDSMKLALKNEQLKDK